MEVRRYCVQWNQIVKFCMIPLHGIVSLSLVTCQDEILIQLFRSLAGQILNYILILLFSLAFFSQTNPGMSGSWRLGLMIASSRGGGGPAQLYFDSVGAGHEGFLYQ